MTQIPAVNYSNPETRSNISKFESREDTLGETIFDLLGQIKNVSVPGGEFIFENSYLLSIEDEGLLTILPHESQFSLFSRVFAITLIHSIKCLSEEQRKLILNHLKVISVGISTEDEGAIFILCAPAKSSKKDAFTLITISNNPANHEISSISTTFNSLDDSDHPFVKRFGVIKERRSKQFVYDTTEPLTQEFLRSVSQ